MTDHAGTTRPELAPLPPKARHLPVDSRGYPVPWFVQWLVATAEGGVLEVEADTPGAYPEFRIMDGKKWRRAINESRCWVCGGFLGVFRTFVVGPMCGINRTTTEPPCHRACAIWSAQNCPFLARPHMERRQAEEMREQLGATSIGGMGLTRNPGVVLVWTTKTFEVWAPKPGERLIQIGAPTEVLWFAEGRPATRAEVEESVRTGLPALMSLAQQQQDEEGVPAVAELERLTTTFAETYYPTL